MRGEPERIFGRRLSAFPKQTLPFCMSAVCQLIKAVRVRVSGTGTEVSEGAQERAMPETQPHQAT